MFPFERLGDSRAIDGGQSGQEAALDKSLETLRELLARPLIVIDVRQHGVRGLLESVEHLRHQERSRSRIEIQTSDYTKAGLARTGAP
jgi:hypothetical protein